MANGDLSNFDPFSEEHVKDILSPASKPKPLPDLSDLFVAPKPGPLSGIGSLLSKTSPQQSSAPSPVVANERTPIEMMEHFMQQLRIAGAKGSFDRTAKLRWVVQMRAALILIYGAKSSLILKFEKWRIEFAKGVPDDLFRARVAEAESLLQYLQCPGSSGSPVPISRASLTPSTREVFIIHGHDELNWRRLSALLRDKFQLEPNIIATRAGQSQSIIDKFETNASRCAFAFALFTPDDVVEKDDTRYHQGRPNVIFETGWFVGRLGKRRVLLLLKDGTKIHSDLDGLNRVQFRDNIEDKYLEIERELIAAGFSGGPV